MWDKEKRSTYKWCLINRVYVALRDFSACLGVAGIPLLRALSLSPILSIQVPQLNWFPPYTKPVSGFTLATILKPEKVHNKADSYIFQKKKKYKIISKGFTFISHVAVNLWSGVPLSELYTLHVARHSLMNDLIQQLILWHHQNKAILVTSG